MQNNKTEIKKIWFKKTDEFNLDCRYFDHFIINNKKCRVVFITLDKSDFCTTKTTNLYPSFKSALNHIQQKTKIKINPFVTNDLTKIIKTANEILSDKNNYFAVKFL